MSENVVIDFSMPDYIIIGKEFTVEYTIHNPLDIDVDVFITFSRDSIRIADDEKIVKAERDISGSVKLIPDTSPYKFNIHSEAYSDNVLIGVGNVEVMLTTKPSKRNMMPIMAGLGGIIWGGLSEKG